MEEKDDNQYDSDGNSYYKFSQQGGEWVEKDLMLISKRKMRMCDFEADYENYDIEFKRDMFSKELPLLQTGCSLTRPTEQTQFGLFQSCKMSYLLHRAKLSNQMLPH